MPLDVKQHTRDLGAHLNTIRATRNATMRKRAEIAAETLQRMKHMPMGRSQMANIVKCKIYPMAMYAAEVTPIPVKEMKAVATKVVDLFLPRHSKRRSQDIFWMIGVPGIISPWQYAAKKRIEAVRVAHELLEKGPFREMDRILQTYIAEARKGTRMMQPPGQDPAQPVQIPKGNGPVARLLDTLASLGATINQRWEAVSREGEPISLLTAPKQQLNKWMQQSYAAKHYLTAARKRTFVEAREGYDYRAAIAGRPKLNDKNYPAWLMIVTGACWTGKQDHEAGFNEEVECRWCRAKESGIEHLLTRCPEFNTQRENRHPDSRDSPFGEHTGAS